MFMNTYLDLSPFFVLLGSLTEFCRILALIFLYTLVPGPIFIGFCVVSMHPISGQGCCNVIGAYFCGTWTISCVVDFSYH